MQFTGYWVLGNKLLFCKLLLDSALRFLPHDWHEAFYMFKPRLQLTTTRKVITMLSWSLTFLIIALIAAVLGFGGVAGAAAGIAKVLFFVFLILLIISAVAGAMRGKKPM
jgi:uncharacterized membrane protein YtjA (UPF0391 family)